MFSNPQKKHLNSRKQSRKQSPAHKRLRPHVNHDDKINKE